MSYVDGYVIPVPNAKRQAYIDLAKAAAKIFIEECGAITVTECWGDDVPEGKVTSFPMAIKRQADEGIVFSWVLWPSRAVRDVGMKKMMDHPSFQSKKDMPFDGQRMIFGGFEVVVQA